MKNIIVVFSKNFRISDNKLLNYSCEQNSRLILLYVDDPDLFSGSASNWFLHHALKSFSQDLKSKYNANLLIKKGDIIDILQNLVKKYQINEVIMPRSYDPEAIKKQNILKKKLPELLSDLTVINDTLLFNPEDIKNLSGSYFKVFTPFWKSCLSKIHNLSKPCPAPKSINLINLEDSDIKNNENAIIDLNLLPKNPNWAKNWGNLYKVSEDAAHDMANDFISKNVYDYKKNRDFPAINGTSKLSPYLNFGLISPKQIYYKLIPFIGHNSVDCFLSEIGWREFSYNLIHNFPNLRNKNFNAKFDNFPWQENEEYLKSWQYGNTGIAIIDAAMRQLYETGWMHNRVRMIVASFLTKNLLIDWKKGAKWFEDCLVDADLAVNSASWQWVAGCGADAAPYFRIFSPILQSKKFDSETRYIKNWVTELKDAKVNDILNIEKISSYMHPIVDLPSSRNKALEAYSMLKK